MSSLDVSTLFRSEKLACEIEISSKIQYDILPNTSKIEPKWPSQLREFIPKLKNHCKFDILTKKQVFLLYSSVYYRYRLNRKESLNFALFSMKIFMIIHISCGLPQNYYNISTKYLEICPPPSPKRPKSVFSHKLRRSYRAFF